MIFIILKKQNPEGKSNALLCLASFFTEQTVCCFKNKVVMNLPASYVKDNRMHFSYLDICVRYVFSLQEKFLRKVQSRVFATIAKTLVGKKFPKSVPNYNSFFLFGIIFASVFFQYFLAYVSWSKPKNQLEIFYPQFWPLLS